VTRSGSPRASTAAQGRRRSPRKAAATGLDSGSSDEWPCGSRRRDHTVVVLNGSRSWGLQWHGLRLSGVFGALAGVGAPAGCSSPRAWERDGVGGSLAVGGLEHGGDGFVSGRDGDVYDHDLRWPIWYPASDWPSAVTPHRQMRFRLW